MTSGYNNCSLSPNFHHTSLCQNVSNSLFSFFKHILEKNTSNLIVNQDIFGGELFVPKDVMDRDMAQNKGSEMIEILWNWCVGRGQELPKWSLLLQPLLPRAGDWSLVPLATSKTPWPSWILLHQLQHLSDGDRELYRWATTSTDYGVSMWVELWRGLLEKWTVYVFVERDTMCLSVYIVRRNVI